MALAARITNVGATVGFGQGELAGDRQNLHALIKVEGPVMYHLISSHLISSHLISSYLI